MEAKGTGNYQDTPTAGDGLRNESKSFTPANRRIPSLDGLRTISIVLVLLGHLYGTAHYPKNALTFFLARYAHLGVQIFFGISGFLITTLLLNERRKTGRIDFYAFYLRRTRRIFPAAFFYITVMAIVARPGYLGWAYSYTMCYAGQGRPWLLGHLWSLSVEEQFYLLWPFVLAFGFFRKEKIGFAAMLLTPFARLIFWRAGMRDIDEYFPAVADSLVAGCLLAFYRPVLQVKARWLTQPLVFLALGALTASIPWMLPRVRMQIFLGGLPSVVIALFIFAAIERRDWLLNNRVTYALGVLSYSLYLWQQPFLNHASNRWWTAFPVNILLALACAIGSYYVVERPFLRMSHAPRVREAAGVA
jgi:peptidoglycan/LPS O-acetylase OafA/YrhL